MLKKLYYDMRVGQTVVFPVISMVNFIIISHSLTSLGMIPSYLYVPLFISAMATALVVIGHFFRKTQQSTEFELIYEKNTEMIKTLDAILSQDPQKIKERMDYHKRIIGN